MMSAIRVRAFLLLSALALAASAQAAQLRIPPIAGATATVRLVDASNHATQILGFVGSEWADVLPTRLALDTEQVLALDPTADIATTEATATCYLVTVSAPGRRSSEQCVQLADTAEVQDLAVLSEAVTIPPGSVLAERLPPDPGTAADGLLVGTLGGEYVLSAAPPGSGTVTSVAITGADGIEVDSGSPITSAGTIQLGLDIPTLTASLGLADYVLSADLAPVATSGAYADLSGLPSLGSASALNATPADGECVEWDGTSLVGAGAACGTGSGGGDATDLGAEYLPAGVAITSSTGADVTVLPAVAGVSAGMMSAAQASTLAGALQAAEAAAAAPVQSVAGRTGAVTLTLADISDAGTAAAADTGTGAGDVVALDGSARLPAVDGSQLTNLPSGGGLPPDYIHFDNADCVEPVSAVSIRINGGGTAQIDGATLTWSADVGWSGSSGTAPLAAEGLVYGYLYDSGGGTAALDVTTTAPVYSISGQYWHETGGSGRRLVWSGLIWQGENGYRILPFITQCADSMRLWYLSDVDGEADWRFAVDAVVLSGGTASTATSISLSNVPPVATEWLASVKLAATAANDDGIIGLAPVAWSASPTGGAATPYTVRAVNPTSGSRTFFGRFWLPVTTPQTAYYGLQAMAGSPSAYVESVGFSIPLH
jgi:hypothetical protein